MGKTEGGSWERVGQNAGHYSKTLGSERFWVGVRTVFLAVFWLAFKTITYRLSNSLHQIGVES